MFVCNADLLLGKSSIGTFHSHFTIPVNSEVGHKHDSNKQTTQKPPPAAPLQFHI